MDVFPRVGVVGGGTMGAGIAAVVLRSGRQAWLCDLPERLAAAKAAVASLLAAEVRRGRLSAAEEQACLGRLSASPLPAMVSELGRQDLVVEAVPEDLAVKQAVLEELAGFLGVVATNTSSLSLALLARSAPDPRRFLGLHFFNPALRMRLVEVVAAPRTEEAVLQQAEAFAKSLGKVPVRAPDLPGFLVNRLARPFYAEALRLLEAGIAPSPAAVDRLLQAAGFPMGPFRLMDLIGLDVNLAVTRSVFEATGFDPRYRPSVLQVRRVEAGLLGDKTGEGFYRQAETREDREDPPPPEAFAGRLFIAGASALARDLRQRAKARGLELSEDPRRADVRILADAVPVEERAEALGHLGDGSAVLLAVAYMGSAASFRLMGARRTFAFSFLPGADAADYACPLQARDEDRRLAAAALGSLFRTVVMVGDGPGLVLARVVSALAAEAYAYGAAAQVPEAVVDEAVHLGLNYPRGPFALAQAVGVRAVLSCLEAMERELQTGQYPIPPRLRLAAAAEMGR